MVLQNNGVNNPVIGEYEEGMDSLKHQEHKTFSNDRYYMRLVREAARYYDDMKPLRDKWHRANDFFMGRQLNDKVVYNGRSMTVETYMKMRELPIFQNDIISDKVLTLAGLLRQENMAATCKSTDSGEDMYAALFSEFLRTNDNLNRRQDFNSDLFLPFMVYGFCAAKVNYTERDGREDVYLDAVNGFDLALPPFEKKDLSDVNFIAEAHDMYWSDILKNFCVDKEGNASKKAEEDLKSIYVNSGDTISTYGTAHTGFNQTRRGSDFLHSNVAGKYRVIEIWKKERRRALWVHDYATAEVGYRLLKDKKEIDAENAQRLMDNVRKDEYGNSILDEYGNETYYIDPDDVQLIDYNIRIEEFWYYRFLSPTGYLLAEGVSPYRRLRNGYGYHFHPYVFLAYPCLHGETRSLVDRVIDKQRATNHYFLMIDSLLGNSLKAVAIDVKSETPRQSLDEMIRESTKPNGVVLYNSDRGKPPVTLSGNNIPAGLEWVINQSQGIAVTQSGVQGAMQGVHHYTSGAHYKMEREAAATSVADYMGAFYDFLLRVSKVQLLEIQQYYDSNRSVKISGEDVKQYFDPVTMDDIGTDLAMEMDANSSVMREANNDMLWQLMLQNRIDLLTMLDCGSWSNTARLKRRIEEYQQQQAAAAAATGVMPAAGGGGVDVDATPHSSQDGLSPQPTVGTGGVSS